MIMDIVNELHAMYYNVESESDERICQEAIKEIQTLRAKVEVLVEYKNSVIDHFIVAFHGYDESKSVYDNLSLLIAYYQELALDPKVSKEASDLHAKVASAEVLVESLEALVDNFKIMENGFNKTLFDKARKALATYDKLSEVSDDL